MFENIFLTTDEMLQEYIIKVICKKIILGGMFISSLGIGLCILTVCRGDKLQLGIYVVVTLITILTTIGTPLITYKEVKNGCYAIHGGKKYKTIVWFDDKIHMEEGSFKIEIDYSQIQKIHILKKSCVLMFGKNNAIMIEKNSFTKGTFNELVIFLKEKCVNLSH